MEIARRYVKVSRATLYKNVLKVQERQIAAAL